MQLEPARLPLYYRPYLLQEFFSHYPLGTRY